VRENDVCEGSSPVKIDLAAEDGDDKRERNLERNVRAGRMFGGDWAKKGRVPRRAYGAGSCAPCPDLV
jgi:hypothetical protein